jgi:hypothetical protein
LRVQGTVTVGRLDGLFCGWSAIFRVWSFSGGRLAEWILVAALPSRPAHKDPHVISLRVVRFGGSAGWEDAVPCLFHQHFCNTDRIIYLEFICQIQNLLLLLHCRHFCNVYPPFLRCIIALHQATWGFGLSANHPPPLSTPSHLRQDSPQDDPIPFRCVCV